MSKDPYQEQILSEFRTCEAAENAENAKYFGRFYCFSGHKAMCEHNERWFWNQYIHHGNGD